MSFEDREFTWSNMQDNALLEKLYWVFTSSPWSNLTFPNTKVIPLSRPISDHIPYVVLVNTLIPKALFFRFENSSIEFPGFQDNVKLHWESTPFYANTARTLSRKFKQVRRGSKNWSNELSKLSKNIYNCSRSLFCWMVYRMLGHYPKLKQTLGKL
jgi:hypothetical protein